MPPPTATPHITRNEPSRTWWVRIWDHKLQDYRGNRYFGDAPYGSKEASLAAAIQFRDKLVARHKIVAPADRNGGYARQVRNTSGVVGVSVDWSRRGRPKVPAYWKASLGRNTREHFSIAIYGYVGAYRLAVEARYRMMGLPVPKRLPKPPPAPSAPKKRVIRQK